MYRNGDRVTENARLSLSNENPIPKPDYTLIEIESYFAHNKMNPYLHPGFVPIESGRGCSHSCSFCAPAKMWGSTVRYRPIPEIIEEMKFLAQKGGDFSFFTQDNLEESFLQELSKSLIDKDVGILWGCYSRLDQLSSNIAPLLSKAGCRLIFTGFETPNRSAQKAIRKIIDSSRVFKNLQHYNKNGIKFIGSFIAGFPGETDEDLENTMQFAIECSAGISRNEIYQRILNIDQKEIPKKNQNICLIHPLCYMPGTDSFEKIANQLHISKYSLHPDCYGSYLFSYEQFKNDWSFLGVNPYLNHLPDKRVRHNCSVLRLFNFLNCHPFYFAVLLSITKKEPLEFTRGMVGHLGEEFVLTATIHEFEDAASRHVASYLDCSPEWTVKKGLQIN